jgi:threonine dehydrogenase-like Zn-dependent dehydrogenase
MAAEACGIQPGDTIAVFGCGPVGQFAIKSAYLLGAERVIAIDRVAERLAMAEQAKAETINFEKEDVYDRLMEMTKGRGPDSCIDAVGAEAHATGSFDAVIDAAKTALEAQCSALKEQIQSAHQSNLQQIQSQVNSAKSEIQAAVQ